ncbi:hypothetical protein [Nocardioides sp. WS12]|uniref:hypothetical protein n=1 Tax=Nocardioides sp. WS12 TaxID=2486272 RepID=UPI0015F9CC56|nr:hypothetical protein [Nocardioides sp. WS12]
MAQSINGIVLERILASGARFSEPQLLGVADGMLTGLAQMHSTGAVHGRLGPHSVLLTAEGGVWIFGATEPSQAYAAPELLVGQQAGPASDVYAAAAVLAQLVRGTVVLPPTAADLDPAFGWLLGPALSVDPAARPTAGAALEAVRSLAESRHGPDWRRLAVLGGLGTGLAATSVVVLAGTSSAATGAAAASGLAAGGVAATGIAATGVGGTTAGGVAAGGVAASGAVGGATVGGGAGLSTGLIATVGGAIAVGVVGATAAVVVLTGGGSTEKHDLTATADIYLAGVSEDVEATMSDPGTRPLRIDLDGAGTVSFPSVSGEAGACSGCEPESIDGGNLTFPSTNLSALNGISGVIHEDRTLFVVGVFLGDDDPDQQDQADLSGAESEETQEPEIGEVFFIGDGQTEDGTTQEVVVPDGAQTLYLGFADGFAFQGAPGAYGDNSGTVDIEVTLD